MAHQMKPLAKPIHVDIPKLIFIWTIRELNLEQLQLPFWPQVTQFKSSNPLPTLPAINRFGSPLVIPCILAHSYLITSIAII